MFARARHPGGVRLPEPVPPIHRDEHRIQEIIVGQGFDALVELYGASDQRIQPVENAKVETTYGSGPHIDYPKVPGSARGRTQVSAAAFSPRAGAECGSVGPRLCLIVAIVPKFHGRKYEY